MDGGTNPPETSEPWVLAAGVQLHQPKGGRQGGHSLHHKGNLKRKEILHLPVHLESINDAVEPVLPGPEKPSRPKSPKTTAICDLSQKPITTVSAAQDSKAQ